MKIASVNFVRIFRLLVNAGTEGNEVHDPARIAHATFVS